MKLLFFFYLLALSLFIYLLSAGLSLSFDSGFSHSVAEIRSTEVTQWSQWANRQQMRVASVGEPWIVEQHLSLPSPLTSPLPLSLPPPLLPPLTFTHSPSHLSSPPYPQVSPCCFSLHVLFLSWFSFHLPSPPSFPSPLSASFCNVYKSLWTRAMRAEEMYIVYNVKPEITKLYPCLCVWVCVCAGMCTHINLKIKINLCWIEKVYQIDFRSNFYIDLYVFVTEYHFLVVWVYSKFMFVVDHMRDMRWLYSFIIQRTSMIYCFFNMSNFLAQCVCKAALP